MNTVERALRYVEACPPAIAGQGGHRQTFAVANRLVNGFTLDADSALRVLETYNEKCQPQWSRRELQHKLQSAAERGRVEIGAFTNDSRPNRSGGFERELALPIVKFDAIARWLSELCPIVSQPDVSAFLSGRRVLVAADIAGMFALPPPNEQPGLVADMVLQFGESDVLRSGLVKVDEKGTRRFTLPRNRLCIPWRRPTDGAIQTLQRRFIGHGEPVAKYATPRGRAPKWPFGAELLAPDSKIVFCEGALDALAIRAMALDPRTLPLAIPGVDGWRDDWTRFTRGRDVVIALDADKAGRGRADSLRTAIEATGEARSITVHFPPSGKDWGDYLKATTP